MLEIQRPGETMFTTVPIDDPRLSFQDFPIPNDPTNRTYTYSNVQRSEHGTMFTCNVNSNPAPDPSTLTVNCKLTMFDLIMYQRRGEKKFKILRGEGMGGIIATNSELLTLVMQH